LTKEHDSREERERLCQGYDALDGLSAKQRLGASLIVSGRLREWFDALVLKAIAYLDELGAVGT
jgi:hypothetical protein